MIHVVFVSKTGSNLQRIVEVRSSLDRVERIQISKSKTKQKKNTFKCYPQLYNFFLIIFVICWALHCLSLAEILFIFFLDPGGL